MSWEDKTVGTIEMVIKTARTESRYSIPILFIFYLINKQYGSEGMCIYIDTKKGSVFKSSMDYSFKHIGWFLHFRIVFSSVYTSSRFAPERFALDKSAPPRNAFLKSAPDRSALVRFA